MLPCIPNRSQKKMTLTSNETIYTAFNYKYTTSIPPTSDPLIKQNNLRITVETMTVEDDLRSIIKTVEKEAVKSKGRAVKLHLQRAHPCYGSGTLSQTAVYFQIRNYFAIYGLSHKNNNKHGGARSSVRLTQRWRRLRLGR